MSFEVQVFGTKELVDKIGKVGGYLSSPRFKALLHDAGEAYRLAAWREAPKQSRDLAKSVNAQVHNFGTPNVQLRIGFDQRGSRYARHVEFGTGPSVRMARARRFMHWFTAGPGGKTIQQPWGLKGQSRWTSHFAKIVRHPGTKAQPFFLKHLAPIRTRLIEIMQKHLDALLKGGPAI